MTKGNLINNAYSRGKISGLTKQPTPEDISIALNRLESLAAEWEGDNICTGYAFEDTPDPNTPHNVERKYWSAYESNLMFWLLSDFGKPVPQTLAIEAKKTFSRLQNGTTVITRTRYPSRMPRGQNQRRYNYGDSYYHGINAPPNTCDTKQMFIGDIEDFTEHFDSYLDLGETIASYTIEATSGLSIVSDANLVADINYQLEAIGGEDSTSSTQNVKIIITTSTGRKNTRITYFALTEAI